MNSGGITVKPPSPCTGSRTMQATDWGSTCALNMNSRPFSASSVVMPR